MRPLLLLIVAVLLVIVPSRVLPQNAPSARATGITESARLVAVYDEILNARFERARQLLSRSCPPAPTEACLALEGVVWWWQVVLDPEDLTIDDKLEAATAAAIDAAATWTVREPERAEAWFYLAGSYAPLVQWRVLRNQRLAAAREGNRIRSSLERALALDPTLHDAKFGLGMYRYYVDVMPAAARMLRWLLFLPGGDRRLGMREMLDAREHGQLLRGEADFQLHWLYLWYEHQPRAALELLAGLDQRYSANPVFLQRIAEIQSEYLHDHPASATAWQQLLVRARAGRTSAGRLAETRAQLGLASEYDAMFETDLAIDALQSVISAKPAAPVGAVALAQVGLGEANDRLGRRDAAVAAYRAALAAASASRDVQMRARRGIGREPEPTTTAAYRLSLEGLRQLERRDNAAALASLTRARTLRPDDPVIQVRFARALIASGRPLDARRELERVLQSREPVPAIVEASACVEYAALIEQTGDRTRAISYYERALSVVGGGTRAREHAAAAIQRLRS